ncbi:aminoacyl tRNA synthase complex-interacting multifunctional protein 1 isoform X2 [Mangifera indica]|uniref:aminoacyl tRNA synthase complex-interacting multifunctional protein 1 isoform X2 n=1 Tax=Mangifera indica TaxID=29780 RepID=UPI001CFA57A0|nr:aminoacyl tRNA synthase complex-interacting multifunctional protein 1 isoform X2 [Mangifera indica]
MAANGSINSNKKQLIVSALCKHLSLDPKKIVCDAEESDLKTLYSNILKASGKDSSSALCDEVMKWIEFAESFIADSKACFDVLSKFNEELTPKAVLLGNGLRPSEADVVVFSTVHSSVIGLPKAHQEKLPHVVRWMDYIQSIEDFKELFENVSVEKARFEPPVEVESNAKKITQSSKNADKSEAGSNTKTTDRKEGKGATQEKKESIETETVGKDKKKKATGDKDATQEMKKSSETEASEKDKELSVSLLNIQVGLIRKAWKHPSADSLLVEEIDIGEAKVRQVVSGLAKYCNPDELTNRRVVLITNVKPGKLRDVMSEGLVLCASNEDHTVVEPLLPPGGAKPGERVSFSGIDGKPEDVLNPKKKQLEKITPHLFTDEKGVATFKGIPFMTSAGPCTSSILKASIK